MRSNTCRTRKLKCDEQTPICGRCQKTGRFCDRTDRNIISSDSKEKQSNDRELPSPSNPLQALERHEIARYFHHYTEIAKWYDLSDHDSTFATVVPEIALKNPLLFSAVVATSAMLLYKTIMPSAKRAAEFYHSQCVSSLIALQENDETVSTGIPLAAVCLLRAYETLSEENDPNRHLLGAYSLASNEDLLSNSPKDGLFMAGFWNYLREDITFSLFERCPIKMDLAKVKMTEVHFHDEEHLNTISLLLGRIINLAFAHVGSTREWELLYDLVVNWWSQVPESCKPYSRTRQKDPNVCLPSIWYLKECHVAISHYYHVCMILLHLNAHKAQVFSAHLTLDEALEYFSLQICGSAFTSQSASVIVNAFGPMCYCGQFLRNENHRDELVRQILGTKRQIGWPGHVIVHKLKLCWLEIDQKIGEHQSD